MKCISWFKMYTRIIVTIPSFLQDLVYLLYQQTKDLRGDFSFKWIIKNTSNWHINDKWYKLCTVSDYWLGQNMILQDMQKNQLHVYQWST